MQPFISIILSGGQSRRMGQDKALLALGETTLIDCQYQRLQQLGAPVWISGDYPNYPCIGDQSPASGPLAGIGSAMREFRLQAQALLVIAVDMPLLTAKVLQQFLALTHQHQQCIYLQQAIFPIWLPLSDGTLRTTYECEQSGHFALKPWLNKLNAKVIQWAEPMALTNTNTPEQWQQAIERLHRETSYES
ncbi:molybdenum cofactor guanylyltransferase [Celerinatantimonas yamalensis]|uniref:Molybdenum cofactor guanylyltransferase n=1 Tax=Celerinatantimonas yamalensis TaxID=559956 RepID=A0ABW9G3C2_9GAMM